MKEASYVVDCSAENPKHTECMRFDVDALFAVVAEEPSSEVVEVIGDLPAATCENVPSLAFLVKRFGAQDPKDKLELKENVDSGVYVKDLTTFVVKSAMEIDHVMQASYCMYISWARFCQ